MTQGVPTGARVVSLHRHPVKSLSGEPVAGMDLDDRGAVGDRTWSLRCVDGRIASGKSTRRFTAVPGLLGLRARERHGVVEVGLPDGAWYAVDAPDAARAAGEHLGQPVALVRETDVSHFDDGPVSLIGLPSVQAVGQVHGRVPAVERFRPNVVLGGAPPFAEEEWVGRTLHVGGAVLHVDLVSPRCTMVDAATADLPAERGLLRSLGRARGARLGVVATVRRPGRLRIGDEVHLA